MNDTAAGRLTERDEAFRKEQRVEDLLPEALERRNAELRAVVTELRAEITNLRERAEAADAALQRQRESGGGMDIMAEAMIADLTEELRMLKERVASTDGEMGKLLASTSWKVTKPLRSASAAARGILKR